VWSPDHETASTSVFSGAGERIDFQTLAVTFIGTSVPLHEASGTALDSALNAPYDLGLPLPGPARLSASPSQPVGNPPTSVFGHEVRGLNARGLTKSPAR